MISLYAHVFEMLLNTKFKTTILKGQYESFPEKWFSGNYHRRTLAFECDKISYKLLLMKRLIKSPYS